jgi:hypothetical protein
MASPRKNPHYGLHNKVLKLEGQNKSMLIKTWNKSVNYMLRTLEPTMTPRLNFYPRHPPPPLWLSNIISIAL